MKKQNTTKYIFLILLFCCNSIFAQLKLARIFGNGAVLQRNKPIPVWGWAQAGAKVTVLFNGSETTTTTNTNGKWTANIPSQVAGGPFQLIVKSNTETLEIKDILVGEVYLLSGQSNMAWTVSQADNFDKEKLNANFSQIRHFKVANEVSLEAFQDLTAGSWVISKPETVGNFSAVGYFFAKELYQKYKVPIGLLNSSWGGSQVEGWISKEGMLASKIFNNYAQKMPKNWLESNLIADKELRKKIFGDSNYNPSLEDEAKYLSQNYEPKGWASNQSPTGQWDWKGFYSYRGIGFALRNFNLDNTQLSQKIILNLPPQDARTQIYINGKLLADSTMAGNRKVEIPKQFLVNKQNRIAIKSDNCVSQHWFGPGMYGKPSDIYLTIGSEHVDLSEQWYLRTSFAEKHDYAKQANMVGTTIFNGMIAPILPYALEGILWYQGESNAGRAYQYRESFPLLINDWRRLWNEEIPFHFVQLSSFGKEQNSNEGSNWAELREAQTMALNLAKTAMVVTTDVGNANDIHPTNKQTVGYRMALANMKYIKNENIVASGPSFKSVKFKKSKAIITFDNIGNGLMVKDKYNYLKGFEIAGKDKVFEYGPASIKNNVVTIKYSSNKKPKAVRYAWADAPIEANLFNKEGLPANSFRTDDWNTKTLNAKYGE